MRIKGTRKKDTCKLVTGKERVAMTAHSFYWLLTSYPTVSVASSKPFVSANTLVSGWVKKCKLFTTHKLSTVDVTFLILFLFYF